MNNLKNSNSKKKKRRRSQDLERFKDTQMQIKQQQPAAIPECEVCEQQKADFYCETCKIHYCINCESQVHTPLIKKRHNLWIFKEPYIPKKGKFFFFSF
ncbi:zinc finger protein constans-like [Anaeramoeba flamelloides]|uniref:Zinc finger protein constans-like n=1 Tax=Anaeramoeba flamelloides TaxID=1746091 RepID=A0AAV7ZEE5_9EUKA|nr:zinc finger protein constans-like [Anaeramoeba flamelloides]